MRRKHLRYLANLVRLVPLAICAAAATTAMVWYGQPELVDRAEHWLLQQTHNRCERLWVAARKQRNPEQAKQQLEALLKELGDVRRMDYQARIFTDCLLRLSQLAERKRNLDEAIALMERSVQFNENDLHTKTRLADLLCRQEATREEGLQLLHGLNEMVPGNPLVATALVRNLAKAGAFTEAAEHLIAATTLPEPNYWQMRWGVGEQDQLSSRVGLIHQRVGSEIQMQFEFEDAVGTLDLRPSPFHSMVFLRPQLHVDLGEASAVVDLSDPQYTTVRNIIQQPGRLSTFGNGSPQIVIRLPHPIPPETLITFSAEAVDMPCAELANVVRSPVLQPFFDEPTEASAELKAAMRQIRRLATATDPLQVQWSGPEKPNFNELRSAKAAMGSLPTAAGVEFAVQLPITPAGSMDRLRIDLPAGKGIRYRLDTLEIANQSGEVSIDASAMAIESSHSLERSDGWYTTTGPQPHFVFALPRPLDGVTGIKIGGLVQ